MAIVQNPLTGRSSGKFAGAIFQTYFNKNVIRSKPLQVRNPKSELQTSNRTGFAFVQSFISRNLAIFRSTCQALAVNQSVYIACISYYLQNVLQGTYPNFYFNSNAMLFSYGNLPGISIDTYEYEGGSTITLNLSSAEAQNPTYEHDLIHVVAYNTTSGNLQYFQTQSERKDLAVILENVEGAAEDALLFFAFCFNPNTNKFSNTSTPVEVELTDSTPQALEITFDDIANAPARTLEAWNTFFDLPTNGTAFTSYEESVNTCKLFGGSEITLKTNLFNNVSTLISFVDNIDCITNLASHVFHSCANVTSIVLPALTFIADECFVFLTSLVTLNLSALTNINNSSSSAACFEDTTGLTITLSIPHSIFTHPDIAYLNQYNTLTINYSD